MIADFACCMGIFIPASSIHFSSLVAGCISIHLESILLCVISRDIWSCGSCLWLTVILIIEFGEHDPLQEKLFSVHIPCKCP